MNQNSFYCPQCCQPRLFQQQTINHTPHILASVFLCGLWLPIWIISAITDNQPWRCSFCGYSDATEYLKNPQLKAIHAQQAGERRSVMEQTRIDRAGSSFQERAAYFVSDNRKPLLVMGVLAGVVGFLVFMSVAWGVPRAPVQTASKPNQGTQSPDVASIFSSDRREVIQKRIREKVGKPAKAWDNFEFTKWEPNAITVYLNYKQMPNGMLEVELATKIIAKATLDVLRENGYDARSSWLALFVHAQRREAGAGGSPVVRRFGKTMYDFNNDSLEFEPISR
jgi:hypothetical protein